MGRRSRRWWATLALLVSLSLLWSLLLTRVLLQGEPSTILSLSLSRLWSSPAPPPTWKPFEVAWQSLVPEQDEERLAVAFFAWQRDRMQEVLLSGRYCVPRAVIWRSYAGIGNRVMQLASLVHFAALTSRPILVDWQSPGTFERYFEPLVEHSNFADFEDKLCPVPGQVIRMGLMSDRNPPLLSHFLELLEIHAPDVVLRPIVTIHTHMTLDPVVASLQKRTPSLGVRLSGSHLLRAILRPSAHLRSILDPYLAKMRGAFTVGVQIRSEYLDFGQDQIFYRCFQEIAQQQNMPSILFLTTESEQVVERFKEEAGNQLLYVPKKIIHIDAVLSKEDLSSVDATMVDFFLLGHSNVTLVTSGSTFGEQSASLGRALNPSAVSYPLGNFRCWVEREECHNYDLPPICEHAKEKLQPQWKSFDHFGEHFLPKWMQGWDK